MSLRLSIEKVVAGLLCRVLKFQLFPNAMRLRFPGLNPSAVPSSGVQALAGTRSPHASFTSCQLVSLSGKFPSHALFQLPAWMRMEPQLAEPSPFAQKENPSYWFHPASGVNSR